MPPEQFEQVAFRRFPALHEELLDHTGLLTFQLGALGRHAQRQLAARNWRELDRVFRFVEECYTGGDPAIQNAVNVSFLEDFDFGEDEERVRSLMGEELVQAYEAQMAYMAELKRQSDAQAARGVVCASCEQLLIGDLARSAFSGGRCAYCGEAVKSRDEQLA